MKLSGKAGFTIVETMLFLGITAFLIVGFLAGTGSTINNQRYRDSVESLAAIIQQQYSEVSNVSNTRNAATSPDMTCNGLADIYIGGSSPKKIGQSECVFLGKYITYSANTDKLVIRTVVGSPIAATDPLSENSDIAALTDYNIKPIAATASDNYNLEWSPTLVNISNTPISFSILILRSPLSGSPRTFINSTAIISDGSLRTSLVQAVPLSTSLKMCVKRDGVSTMKKSAVMIIANATASSGVQTQGGETSLCN